MYFDGRSVVFVHRLRHVLGCCGDGMQHAPTGSRRSRCADRHRNAQHCVLMMLLGALLMCAACVCRAAAGSEYFALAFNFHRKWRTCCSSRTRTRSRQIDDNTFSVMTLIGCFSAVRCGISLSATQLLVAAHPRRSRTTCSTRQARPPCTRTSRAAAACFRRPSSSACRSSSRSARK